MRFSIINIVFTLISFSIYAQFTDQGSYSITGDSIGIGIVPKAKFHVKGGTKLGSSYFGTVPGSLANSWIRDTWMTASTTLEWDASKNVWRRGEGTYNEFGGIIWEDNATYFIRGNRGDKLEFTNEEFLENSFLTVSVNKNFIGIGTNHPDARLSVNGTVHANEVKVDTKNWSDFVFENKYSLDSLEVVEAFIRDNGHLKSIPSAEEVEKNGILLGEMDAKLLQKIEELTLYLIQQNKEMKALKERIKTLENNN
ncbi:hypothetical protein [Zunongwangia pacifica]|uniref:Peptidase S74 domain-containing protein n=1 Tax=Zunongwangia pacifica TaxID=2911062 RepID=A0A9X1ZVN2_9FLAO|nr:hypothetical protein [Zunongwangia pacifica]MCL6220764.1 hypothetical protein [Zunongwangia pacifica]